MMLWFLVACTCSEPGGTASAPDAVSVPAPGPPVLDDDAPPVPVEADDLARSNAIANACAHIEACGCADQSAEQCAMSSERSALPAMVYICIDKLACDKVCAIGPAGTPGKGTEECVEPYVKAQVGGGGAGLKKRTSSETRPLSKEEYDARVEAGGAPDADR